MAKISVIIPIYNVEKYVEKCLDSVINQTFTDIEIICVDDGSTDSSGGIADQYAALDSRIKVLHKQNGGYGKAINAGFDMAKGDYIGIVESDDFIETDMYERLYEIAEINNLDYVKSRYYAYSEQGRKLDEAPLICQYDTVFSEYENMNKLFLTKSIWTGLYRRKFLVEKNIRLLETPGASYQDTGFWFKVCIVARRGMLIKDAFVNYRIDNENSSVKSSNKVFCICDELEECRSYLENSKLDKDFLVPYLYKYMYQCYVWNVGRIDISYMEEFVERTSKSMEAAVKNSRNERAVLSPSEIEDMTLWASAPHIYCRMLCNRLIMRHNRSIYADFIKQYTDERHIYIYGAGRVGQRLKGIIEKLHPGCLVDFLVSRVDGLECGASEITNPNTDKDCKVIIAVADIKARLEMREKAAEFGFKKVLVWDVCMDYACWKLDGN